MEQVVCRDALPLQNVILEGSRCLQRGCWLFPGRRLVGLRTGSGQQRVGAGASAGDDGIRRFIGIGNLIVERTIGSVAFEAEAFVGLLALRTRKQRIRHWTPSAAASI